MRGVSFVLKKTLKEPFKVLLMSGGGDGVDPGFGKKVLAQTPPPPGGGVCALGLEKIPTLFSVPAGGGAQGETPHG